MARCDVFTDALPAVTVTTGAVTGQALVMPLVTEVIPLGHVLAVGQRGFAQALVPGQRRRGVEPLIATATRLGTRSVDLFENRLAGLLPVAKIVGQQRFCQNHLPGIAVVRDADFGEILAQQCAAVTLPEHPHHSAGIAGPGHCHGLEAGRLVTRLPHRLLYLRATQIRTYDGRRVLVPNAETFTSRVTNNTAAPIRRGKVVCALGYEVDIDTVVPIMCRAAQHTPGVLDTPSASVTLRELGSTELVFDVEFWCDSRRSDFVFTASEVRKALVAALRAAGVALPDQAKQNVVLHTANG